MKTHIPKSFTLGAIEFTVEYGDKVSEGNLGHTAFLESNVLVKTHYDGKTICKQQQEQTFYHELVHCVLGIMNESELNGNEQFVDIFGQLLYQYFKSVKYK